MDALHHPYAGPTTALRPTQPTTALCAVSAAGLSPVVSMYRLALDLAVAGALRSPAAPQPGPLTSPQAGQTLGAGAYLGPAQGQQAYGLSLLSSRPYAAAWDFQRHNVGGPEGRPLRCVGGAQLGQRGLGGAAPSRPACVEFGPTAAVGEALRRGPTGPASMRWRF